MGDGDVPAVAGIDRDPVIVDWITTCLPPDVVLEDLVFCNFKLLPAPLDRLLPHLDVALMRHLQRLGRGPLRWLGTNYVVRLGKP